MNKKELRKKLRERELSLQYISEASRAIQNKLISSAEYLNSRTVFCYLAVEKEVQTALIIQDALKNKELYVPKCLEDGRMVAVRYDENCRLEVNRFGIMEPIEYENTGNDFDLIVVPCVACGRNGERLGHGKGYYDRFMENTAAEKICLCLERNIVSGIPMDDHDVYMNKVMTEETEYCR